MTNNSSVLVDGETPIVIEQGPEWLAMLLYDPPTVLVWALVAVAVATVAGGVYALTRVDVSPTALREIASNLVLATSIAVATHLSVTRLAVGYVLDVGIGVVAGVLLTEMLVRAYDRLSWSVPLRRFEVD
jgi:hypothetical protein